MSAAVDGTLASARALKEGLRLAEAGYYLTPVTIRRTEAGKKRAQFHAQWKRDASAVTTDPEVIRDWSAQHSCSFAIVCGPTGVEGVDLDVDPARDVDAISWWGGESLPLGQLVVETPSGGLHTYWRRGNGRMLPTSASEVAPGVDTRSEGGVFFAPGSFVLGQDGEPEATVYNVQGPLPKVIDLSPTPKVVLDAWAVRRDGADPAPPVGASEGGRYFTFEQAKSYIAAKGIEKLKNASEGQRNNALNVAACVVGHFVPDFFGKEESVRRLRQLALDVGLEECEIGPTVRSGLTAGMGEPFIRVADDDPRGATSDPDADFKRELERERIRRRVRETLDQENREPLRVLDASEFLDAPAPEYLVPKMFYRDGLSVVFGAPGAAKSFLVLDIALCLATGKQWRGKTLGRGQVHYIMAEGQATNTLRALAWLEHHNVKKKELQGRLTVVPTPVVLTEPGIADYLPIVERDKPDMIVLDTKNLMFAGKESQGDDYGQMLRVLHRIREAAGGAAVILIDHSGLTDDSRVRGSNAQKGGLETEVRVTNENGIRRVEITRDKSGSEGAKWAFKLEQVPGVSVRGADVDPPAVCIPVKESEIQALAPFAERDDNWNDPLQAPLPDDVQHYVGKGEKGIKVLARYMRYFADGLEGPNQATARKAVRDFFGKDETGKPRYSDSTINRAWEALHEINRLALSRGVALTGPSRWEERENDPR